MTEPSHTPEESALPIRVVAERTGINSVTLRAWERRYGLLKPLRTAKGHRLYRPEDLERIGAIQKWLARGVSVGQVRALLDEPDSQAEPDDTWEQHRQALRRPCHRLDRGALVAQLGQLSVDYPPELLADRCLQPLLSELRTEQEWQSNAHGSATRLRFFETLLAEWFAPTHNPRRPPARGPRLLLLDTGRVPDPVLPVILAHTLRVQGVDVEFLGPLPEAEWHYAAEQLGARALLAYSDYAPIRGLAEALERWPRQSALPLRVAGRQCAASRSTFAGCNLGQSHHAIVGSLSSLMTTPPPTPDAGATAP